MRRHVLLFAIAASTVSLLSCGIRKKDSNKKLEEIKTSEYFKASGSKLTVVTEIFGDTLTGFLNVSDTSGTDSGEFESNGIKVKIKVRGGKPGTKVDFSAIAKPVARSELNAEATNTEQKKDTKSKTLNTQNNKSVKPLNGWAVTLLILIVVGAICLVVRQVVRKIKQNVI